MATSTFADPNTNYSFDVFISHRGPEVKKTVASHLYRRLLPYGLRVFLDYEELQVAENLTPQIEGAIASASVHVAIFSPDYAGSKWCLDELVLMLNSRKPIVPIFYHVKPSDLRWTHVQGNGVYAEALCRLEKSKTYDGQPRYNSTTIENWRNALSSVPETSGLDLDEFNGDEGEMLDKAIESVHKRVKKPQLNVATHPTGLDGKAQDFERTVLLKQHSGRVQVVGIAGLGGVGKTTLAKYLFNMKSSNYSNSYFLFDVRETPKSSLHSLQKNLLNGLTALDLPVDSTDQGIEMLRKHLKSRHVLIVLDNVDHVDQVNALLPVDVLHLDSLILITSRDKNVLARSGIPELSIYQLTGLDKHHSRKLFCSYAFCQPHPLLLGFESLVEQFLKVSNGLPLSLKVLGGHLNGKMSKSYWESQLDRVQNTLPHEIQQTLQISYDALQTDEKRIFLDIACFLIGQRKDTALKIWEGSRWKGSLAAFQTLQERCLVELDFQNKIRMHDHLRDLGRDLANKEAGLPCSLWRGIHNIDDFMRQSSEIINVRGIKYIRQKYQDDDEDEDDYASFSCYKIKKLQLFDIASPPIQFSRKKYDVFQPFDPEILVKRILTPLKAPNLIWLRWRDCRLSSLPPWIPMNNLWVLEVEGLELETLWRTEKHAPLQLRELRIDAPLTSIPKSIGLLRHLERIVVEGGHFEELPEQFGGLLSLKALSLRYCTKMTSLPESFGNLRNLEHIDLSFCSKFRRLPNSFRDLIRLKQLHMNSCRDLTISFDILENISTLEYISLSCCTLDYNHGWMLRLQHLEQLEVLQLIDCVGLKGIQRSTQMTQLRTLALSGCSELEELLGVEHLRSLAELDASRCVKLKSIRGLDWLTNLLTVNVYDCSELELPSVEHLSSLKELNVSRCVKMKIIRGMEQLAQLRTLNVSQCSELEVLNVSGCVKLKRIMGLENLTQLRALNVSHCYELENINVFRCVKLKSMRGLDQLTELRTLKVFGCCELEELPGVEHLRSLAEIDISTCVKLKNIQGSAQMTQLRALKVSGCSELEELPGIGHLRSLAELNVSRCVKLKNIRGSAQMTKLRRLDVSGCSELKELQGVEHLGSLAELDVSRCVKLQSLQGLEKLAQLRTLNVSSCFDLEELPGVEHLTSLETLVVSICKKLKSIRGSAQMTKLRILNASLCSNLEELPGVEHLTSLEWLDVSECTKLKSIRCLKQLTQLQSLNASGCSELEDLPGIEHLRSLKKLDVSMCIKLKRIRGLAQLIELKVFGCYALEELSGVENLRSLKSLDVSRCIKLKSLQGLEQLTQLETLYVFDCFKLEELPSIEHLRSLKWLDASRCEKLKSIGGLDKLTGLQTLDLSDCSELEGLPSVENLRSLKKLLVSKCVKFKSIQGLEQLTQLRTLQVFGCLDLEELPGVEHLRSLEDLNAFGCVKLKSIRVSPKMKGRLDVSDCSELEELGGGFQLKGFHSKLKWFDVSGCVKLEKTFQRRQRTIRRLERNGSSRQFKVWKGFIKDL